MDSKKILKKTDKVVTRKIEDEVILLPLSKSSKDLNYIYTLNQTAADFWDRINGKKSIDKIKEELLSIYEVDDKTLTKQMNDLAKDLKSIEAIK